MKQCLLAAALLLLLLSACQITPAVPSEPEEMSTQAAEAPAATAPADPERVRELIDHTAVFFPGNGTAYIKGEACSLVPAPFLEDGVLYVPAAPVAALLGGSFVNAGDFYYLNYKGNVSVVMEEYNVLLFNTKAVIMEATPILRDGELCLPLSGLGQALSLSRSKSSAQGLFVLGAQGEVDEALLTAVRRTLVGDSLQVAVDPQLEALARDYGVQLQPLLRAAEARSLWLTDSRGVISALWLDDAGQLQRQTYSMSARFPGQQLFVTEGTQLRSLTGGQPFAHTPDALYVRELRDATGRYMELLAAWHLLGDPQAQALLPRYRNALAGQLEDPTYTADTQAPLALGVYDDRGGEDAWQTLVSTARAGDFLAFSAAGAGAEYGYFNHSALILEADAAAGTLHLLHARSSELGVGADLEMDTLSYAALQTLDYYQNYSTVFLCRGGQLTKEKAAQMAWAAYDKYNGYQFGYGGRLGLEETNCAELIVDAYRWAGVELLEADYQTRLKEVLKGNTKNLVPIPDDLLFSEQVEVIGLWIR